MPQKAAGTRIEPDVSVPIATGTMPAATATAEPDDEPPGAQPGARGFGGVPKCGFRPSPENASSLRFVFPTHTIPASASRATTGRVGRGRRRVAEQRARRRRRGARDIDEVLPRDRDAVERAARRAGAQPLAARSRLAPRPLLGDRHEDRRAGARERLLAHLDGVQLTGREPPAERDGVAHAPQR